MAIYPAGEAKARAHDGGAGFDGDGGDVFGRHGSGPARIGANGPVHAKRCANMCRSANGVGKLGCHLTAVSEQLRLCRRDTRLEMSFMREIRGWGDLQASVRRHLVRSCSQHVPEKAIDLRQVLAAPGLAPIRDELAPICEQLAEVRLTKDGKKTYHLMVACYFQDLALVWQALRRVCQSPCKVCFVIGDSAPYGVYVPVVQWLSKLAEAAGFHGCQFEKTRDRNVKWKNRKHRVPLLEGRLWVEG